MKNFHDLKRFAESQNFIVTSTNGGAHNVGSPHYRGLAIDVRTRGKSTGEIDLFIRKCRILGIIVRDERTKPPGQKVWTGAHLHLAIGTPTAAAVRDFQRRHNLTADGIVGAKTLAILDSLL